MHDIWIQPNARALQRRNGSAATHDFSEAAAANARHFHRTISVYQPTPLHSLACLATDLNLGALWIKDESHRFGLKAFKGLGGSYAAARLVAERLGLTAESLDFAQLTTPAARGQLKDLVFATATAGNHGRGLAWMAQQLGCRCVVYLPAEASPARVTNLEAHDADVTVTEVGFDNTVRLITERALDNGWLLVQDTAWEGYEEIPRLIMQGYLTMLAEAFEQLQDQTPTHVLVQVGVGSLAGAVQGYLVERFGAQRPVVIAVEAAAAPNACQSIEAEKEEPVILGGPFETIMATIACGEMSPLGWPILRDHAEYVAACPDWVGAHGVRLLANPADPDPRIEAGPTGAVTAGLVAALCDADVRGPARETVGLTPESRVLVFLTEGATDPVAHASAIEGSWPTPKGE